MWRAWATPCPREPSSRSPRPTRPSPAGRPPPRRALRRDRLGRRVKVPQKEATMTRMFVDCREYPSEANCTVAISADSLRELIDAAAQHAVAVHGHQDSPELRRQLEGLVKTEAREPVATA